MRTSLNRRRVRCNAYTLSLNMYPPPYRERRFDSERAAFTPPHAFPICSAAIRHYQFSRLLRLFEFALGEIEIRRSSPSSSFSFCPGPDPLFSSSTEGRHFVDGMNRRRASDVCRLSRWSQSLAALAASRRPSTCEQFFVALRRRYMSTSAERRFPVRLLAPLRGVLHVGGVFLRRAS